MSNTEKYRIRLINLLKELFQLDQPELDFGFYKIMHAKSVQVTHFLENDLLKVIQDAFGEADENRIAEARANYEAALEQANRFGAPNPEETDGVKEAKALYEQAKDGGNAESEVYDHLYRFFERYYDNGDFMSRRYYARESDSRAAPYAVPYDGREVYLHWANKDQYYIKSSEYLTNYSFDLNEAIRLEAQKAKGQGLEAFADHGGQLPLKVHFRIVEASEGEHGNIKAASEQKRFFLIHAARPVEFIDGERRVDQCSASIDTDAPMADAPNGLSTLQINFEYRPDAEKTGQDNKWQETRLREAEAAIVKALQNQPAAADFLKGLTLPAPTDSKDKRTLLGKYLQKYAARNTMDYFIHKNLGGFLRRELDFYIKNEIMRLDDIENADVPQVEHYLSKIRVLRRIAQQLIAFLAQLEEFQKKLWLKKKFVTESHYCITLDRIPESFYAEIAASGRQREEWVKLFAIDEIAADPARPGYSNPLTLEFLKANPFLLVDTALFDEGFKQRLLAKIPDLDAQCDGVLIHSENFQALGLMQEKYRKQVKCIYIDPPYNTDGDGFCYKDSYQSSSWCSMMFGRLGLSKQLIREDGTITSAIGREELLHLLELKDEVFGLNNRIADLVWEKGRKNDAKYFSLGHDYMLVYGKNTALLKAQDTTWREEKPGSDEILAEYARLKKIHGGDYAAIQAGIRAFYQSLDKDHPALKHRRYNRVDRNGIWRDGDISWPGGNGPRYDVIHPETGKPCKVPDSGWRFSTPEKFQLYLNHDFIEFRADHNDPPVLKRYLNYVAMDFDPDVKRRSTDANEEGSNVQVMPSVFYKGQQPTVVELRNLMGADAFRNPKEPSVIARLFDYMGDMQAIFLDFFAGSGTTAHSVISLNRKDSGLRKYVLIEQGDHFNTVLKPRIQKVVYSKDWKDGKPVSRQGISHCFKYLRLESYEDVLNNLVFKEDAARDTALANNPELRRDYLLNYFLDVETQGSQSLLNIADFRDPTAYRMRIKKPGSGEQNLQTIDLVETFNWLIGLWVRHMAAPQTFSAEFARETDPDLPQDQNTRLRCTRLKPVALDAASTKHHDHDEPRYWFRLIEGYTLKVPGDNSSKIPTLIVWRKLTDNPEKDNAVLQKYLLDKLQISPREHTYGAIYINGSHTLPNPVIEGEQIKVRLIEEAFHTAMWSGE